MTREWCFVVLMSPIMDQWKMSLRMSPNTAIWTTSIQQRTGFVWEQKKKGHWNLQKISHSLLHIPCPPKKRNNLPLLIRKRGVFSDGNLPQLPPGELTLEVNSLLKEKDLSLDIKDEAETVGTETGWMVFRNPKQTTTGLGCFWNPR